MTDRQYIAWSLRQNGIEVSPSQVTALVQINQDIMIRRLRSEACAVVGQKTDVELFAALIRGRKPEGKTP